MSISATKSKILLANKWIEHVLSKMEIDNEFVSRIVIDAQAGDVMQIYVVFLGSEELLEVRAPTAEGVTIHVVGAQE